jgi:hypothetical protein
MCSPDPVSEQYPDPFFYNLESEEGDIPPVSNTRLYFISNGDHHLGPKLDSIKLDRAFPNKKEVEEFIVSHERYKRLIVNGYRLDICHSHPWECSGVRFEAVTEACDLSHTDTIYIICRQPRQRRNGFTFL